MIRYAAQVIQVIAVLGTISSIGYYLLCLWSGLRFLRGQQADRSVRPTQAYPSVSILKSLRGTDPEMYESFRSHCLQDYPEYEIIFGISDPDDPAVPLVEQLKLEFPQRKIQLLFCGEALGKNIKVSNLIQMLAVAAHDYILVNDSDIR